MHAWKESGEEVGTKVKFNIDVVCSSFQDLFKELILSKQVLKRKDQELKDVKGYLDNLLLRIMETNPSLLSSTN